MVAHAMERYGVKGVDVFLLPLGDAGHVGYESTMRPASAPSACESRGTGDHTNDNLSSPHSTKVRAHTSGARPGTLRNSDGGRSQRGRDLLGPWLGSPSDTPDSRE